MARVGVYIQQMFLLYQDLSSKISDFSMNSFISSWTYPSAILSMLWYAHHLYLFNFERKKERKKEEKKKEKEEEEKKRKKKEKERKKKKKEKKKKERRYLRTSLRATSEQ